MGCDIHMYSEVRDCGENDYKKERGKWIATGNWRQVLATDYSTGEVFAVMEADEADCVYRGYRNYILFSVLADVRNHNRNIIPISSDRGLPDDTSSLIAEYAKMQGDGVHSHSYLTLRELLEYDWNQPYEYSGFGQSEYEAVMEFGDKIVSIEPDNDGVIVKLREPLSSQLKPFMDSLETMKGWLYDSATKPSKTITEDDIRIVFWFDN